MEISRIVLRMPNWLGDLVMATPCLPLLRRKFPHAHITVMCPSHLISLLTYDPHIDELFGFQRCSGYKRRLEQQRVIQELQKGRYDLGILLTNSFSSAWSFYRANIAMRIGYRGHFRSLLLTRSLPPAAENSHQVDDYKALLQILGIHAADEKPRLHLKKEEIEEGLSCLQALGLGGKSIIGIHAGSAYGPAKCWPPSRFHSLAKKLLQDKSVACVFFGDESGKELAAQITSGLGARAVNLAGETSLRQLMALISCCNLFLTGDSGPMHIADALDVKLLALFGSTNPQATRPYKAGEVLIKPAACSPCYKRVCPIDFRCMRQISVDEVLQKIKRMLNKS